MTTPCSGTPGRPTCDNPATLIVGSLIDPTAPKLRLCGRCVDGLSTEFTIIDSLPAGRITR